MDVSFPFLLFIYFPLYYAFEAENYFQNERKNSTYKYRNEFEPLTAKPPTDRRLLILIEKRNSYRNREPHIVQDNDPYKVFVDWLSDKMLLDKINIYRQQLKLLHTDTSGSSESSDVAPVPEYPEVSLGNILRKKEKKKEKKKNKKKKKKKNKKHKKKDKSDRSVESKAYTKQWKDDWLKETNAALALLKEEYDNKLKEKRPYNILKLEPWGHLCQKAKTTSPAGYCVAKETCEYEYRLPHADSYCRPNTDFVCCQLALSSFDVVPDLVESDHYEDPRLYPEEEEVREYEDS